jgi:hypothetical protein
MSKEITKAKGGLMFKWIRAVKELVKDVLMFLQVRKEQRKMYSPIIDDLEIINTLSNALNDQIRNFSKKWDLFPEAQKLIASYRLYYDESQEIYRSTRKDILNNLFAERNKNMIGDSSDSLQVHRQQDDWIVDWDAFVDMIAQKNPLVGKILGSCDKMKTGDVVYIQITHKNKMFLNTLLKYKAMIEMNGREMFGENITVEITEETTEA